MVPGRSTEAARIPAASSSSSAAPAKTSWEMKALGTNRVVHRSIDEIEREHRAARANDVETLRREKEKRELEQQALERRRKAMEQKRSQAASQLSSDQATRKSKGKRSSQSGSGSESDSGADSMFASSDDENRRRKNGASSKTKHSVSPLPSKAPLGKSAAPPVRPPVQVAPVRSFNGRNPADFLPGAKVSADSSIPAPKKKKVRPDDKKRRSDEVEPRKRKVRSEDEAGKEAKPARKETPREKFLREEAERKASRSPSASAKAKAAPSASRPKGKSTQYAESDEESDESESELSESEDYETESESEEERRPGKKRRSEKVDRAMIWEAMGLDRSK
jgi:hypothetical protein